MSIYEEVKSGKSAIAVIGLGYVGLPIALEFARKGKVIGFDINQQRIDQMKNKIDPSDELDSNAFENADIQFTADIKDLQEAKFFVVAVPTPIDQHKLPDLKPLLSASQTVAKAIKKGDYVVFESTVYPGCTEEDCVPVIEKISGLKAGIDFHVGYSPERINPGDTEHTLLNVIKVVSGDTKESLEEIAKVYELVIEAGVHRASSIKVAEAAKIIENTQRDVNIALINELAIIFHKMGINTYEVLEAANTKWNFLNFTPGLVGGHCIGVDPYYLTYKSKEFGYHAQVINSGRAVNDGMGSFIAARVVKQIVARKNASDGARVLVMGTTFKENVSDIRNSKVVDVINELGLFGLHVDVIDPFADPDEVKTAYDFSLINEPSGAYDAIILAVNHSSFLSYGPNDFRKLLNKEGFVFDVKGAFRKQTEGINYMSL